MKKLFLLALGAMLGVACTNDDSEIDKTKDSTLPETEIYVQGQRLQVKGAQQMVTRSTYSWPYHNDSEGWEVARFSIRADGVLPGYIDQSSALYYGRPASKQGKNRGRISSIYPYGRYNDRDLDYYKKDKKTGNNIGLFRYVYDPTGMKTQLAILEQPPVEDILADEVEDIQKGVSNAKLAAVQELLDKGSDYLYSHVLWYVVKEVGMQYGWHVNGIISENVVPDYTIEPDKVPDNVEVDIHQQDHTDWYEIKTSVHVRTDCESVTINIPLKYEDILEQDDFDIRVYGFYYKEYVISHTIKHDVNGITIEISDIPAALIAELKENYGDGLTVEVHSYCTRKDIWEDLKKSSVVKTGKPCTVNGQISTAFGDGPIGLPVMNP